jgi:hypothetical protein
MYSLLFEFSIKFPCHQLHQMVGDLIPLYKVIHQVTIYHIFNHNLFVQLMGPYNKLFQPIYFDRMHLILILSHFTIF